MPPSPPDTPVGRGSGPVRALETLLADLGSQASLASSLPSSSPPYSPSSLPSSFGSSLASSLTSSAREACDSAASFFSTGISPLDAALGGGFPAGRLCEICGVPSSGRTSLALGLIAETLAQGVLVGWIDLADALDPRSAAEAIAARSGTSEDLERLLWVRARSAQEAVQSCERLLRTEGFELVVFDALVLPQRPPSSRAKPASKEHASHSSGSSGAPIHDVTWLRLARLAAGTRTTLVVISSAPLTGSRSEFVLEMQAPHARFVGPPNLLQSIEATAFILRHRSRPSGTKIPLSISAEMMDEETR